MNHIACVAITCIGSGVGQSIVNSINTAQLPIYTVGLGTNPFAFGGYDCNEMASVPSIYDEDYVKTLIDVCLQHSIDMIIPGMDDEVLVLAKAEKQLRTAGLQAIISDLAIAELCRDKAGMADQLSEASDFFVKSYDRQALAQALHDGTATFPLIAKPRGGFASRGVRILLENRDLESISADDIIQELAFPSKSDPEYSAYWRQIQKRVNPQIAEISVQLVTDQNGDLIGRMASYNRLANGVPIEILPIERGEIWATIDSLLPHLQARGLRGPINIQGRLTDQGFKIFEMNPRFTGISGLRALMGFNEVEACILHWRRDSSASCSLQVNYSAFGVRQMADKRLLLARNEEVLGYSSSINGRCLKKKPKILVTGSTGLLGSHLVYELEKTFEIWTLDRIKEQASDGHSRAFDYHDLEIGGIPLGHCDTAILCGFARHGAGHAEIADSLKKIQSVLAGAGLHEVPKIVFISSQAVYGFSKSPPWYESTSVAPETPYAVAKLAAELMLAQLAKERPHLHVASLRLAGLSGGVIKADPKDMITKIARKVLSGNDINIINKGDRFTRLDVQDAVSAIGSLLSIDSARWRAVYNVDSAESFGIEELAQIILRLAQKREPSRRFGETLSQESVADSVSFGMASDLLKHDTGWAPSHNLGDSIESVLEVLQHSNSRDV